MENNKKIILFSIIAICVAIIGILIYILIQSDILKPKNDKKTTTTTTVVEDVIKEDKIMIDGDEDTLRLKTVKSLSNYEILYDIDNFTSKIDNDNIIISNIYDNKIGIKVEVISKEEYKENAKSKESQDKKEGYIYTYTYKNKNDLYLKITKINKNDFEYLVNMEVRLNYMVNSLIIN